MSSSHPPLGPRFGRWVKAAAERDSQPSGNASPPNELMARIQEQAEEIGMLRARVERVGQALGAEREKCRELEETVERERERRRLAEEDLEDLRSAHEGRLDAAGALSDALARAEGLEAELRRSWSQLKRANEELARARRPWWRKLLRIPAAGDI
jgi:chromosome segregation ATPase